jgi:hypothetical protein
LFSEFFRMLPLISLNGGRIAETQKGRTSVQIAFGRTCTS